MTPFYEDKFLTLYGGDCRTVLSEMEPESVHTVVTSPPYWGLRDYGTAGQLGLEPTPEEYVANMVAVFREVRRVLRQDGTVWLNLGDSYAGGSVTGAKRPGSGRADGVVDARAQRNRNGVGAVSGVKPKDLIGVPWMVAFALRADGWYLRSDVIWSKPNAMPEPVGDRPSKAHEYLFLLTRLARYYYNDDAVRGTGNLRSVWSIPIEPYPGAHFATFPRKLVEPCVKAGCPEGGTVLDPFAGSGTTLLVAQSLGRRGVGIDLNPTYAEMAVRRASREFGRGKVTEIAAKEPDEGLWGLDG